MTKPLVFAFAVLVAGCAATVGTTGSFYVPKDAAATCASHCNTVGLALDSVVIMANNVGCVCSASAPAPAPAPGPGPAPAPASSVRASTAGAAGMAALMMQAREAAATQQNR
ncbi:MAG TPA: hypothetical protein VGO00_11260 [Kofleriaceae bacterium]|nr:hypothetical protein [Kofleriaceae bacterium]